MSDKTAIEWADATWSPTTGCEQISPGCKHCYAKREVEQRWSKNPRSIWFGRKFSDVQCHPSALGQPLRWKTPKKIFVDPRSDLFHDDVPNDFLPDVFAVMAIAKHHIFQILTKRPGRMREVLNDHIFFDAVACTALQVHGVEITADDWPLPNVWLGVSVEDQAAADERIPLLLETQAVVRWISAEPLLGALDLTEIKVPSEHDKLNHSGFYPSRFNALTTEYDDKHYHQPPAAIDWVAAGGESGQKARPMHPQWARDLRDQCAVAGVPFLFKQHGEWAHHPEITDAGGSLFHRFEDGTWMQRDGKKAAGRLLDGVLHDEYPVPASR